MKIGILVAQPVFKDLETRYGSFAERFTNLLKGADSRARIQIFRILEDEWPAGPADCDAFLITGSFHGVYDPEPWIPRLAEFIRRCEQDKVKLAGICFGHQIIAHALGGCAHKSRKGWGVGNQTFHIERAFPWMRPGRKKVSLLYFHQDQVVALPPGSVNIGGDEFCPYRMFVVNDHILAIQGHPEFDAAFERALLDLKKGGIPPEVYKAAMASLNKKDDSSTIARWTINFFKAKIRPD